MDSRAASFRGEADALVCTAYVPETVSITFTHVSAPRRRDLTRLAVCGSALTRPYPETRGRAHGRPASPRGAPVASAQWRAKSSGRSTVVRPADRAPHTE